MWGSFLNHLFSFQCLWSPIGRKSSGIIQDTFSIDFLFLNCPIVLLNEMPNSLQSVCAFLYSPTSDCGVFACLWYSSLTLCSSTSWNCFSATIMSLFYFSFWRSISALVSIFLLGKTFPVNFLCLWFGFPFLWWSLSESGLSSLNTRFYSMPHP